MNWINDLEKRRLYEWACKHSKEFRFTEIDKNKNSYYETFDNANNACEFGFDNILEFEEELNKLWDAQPMFDTVGKTCAVAAFKRETVLEDRLKNENQDLIEVPDFVYAF